MIRVRRLGSQIGAEITGVDVRTLDEADFGIIYRALLDYKRSRGARPGAHTAGVRALQPSLRAA